MQKKYYQNVKVGLLKIDPLVQGSLQVKRVNNIVHNFNPKFIGTIVVSKRGNGEYYVMDGFHRSTALKRLKIDEVFCEVHEGLTERDEAEYYLAYNTYRKNPKAVDDFKVSVTAEVPEVIAIQQILKELDIEISESGFRSPKALLDIYKNYGVEITKISLELYVEAWGKKNLKGKYLKVLARFIKNNQEQLELSILRKNMKKYGFIELNELINQMIIAKQVTNSVKAFESLIYYIYNNRLPKNKRIEFIPVTAKE